MTETQTVQIEQASTSDVAGLIALGSVMHKESPAFRGIDYDQETVAELIHLQLDDPLGIVMIVRDRADGKIVGGFIGGVAPLWQSKRTLGLYDYALFLLPDYRRGRLAVELLNEVFENAKHLGATVIQLGHATGLNPDRGDRLYEYLGLQRVGSVFVKALT